MNIINSAFIGVAVFLAVVAIMRCLRIVRPDERGIVERFGKYNRTAEPGLNFVLPGIERLTRINVTEQIDDCESMEVITKDNLNAHVDVQIYYKVLPDADSLKKSQYAVNNYAFQIVNLARTTTRNVIGGLSFKEANSQRQKLIKRSKDTGAMEGSDGDSYEAGVDHAWRTLVKEGWHARENCLAFVPCAECGSERLFSDRNICHSCRTKGWLSPAQVKEKVKQLKDIWKIALAEQRWSDPDVLNECLVQWFKTIDSVFVDEAYAEMLNKGV